MKRRTFIKQAGLATAGIGLLPSAVMGLNEKKGPKKLLIMHTNDMHSHIEPFADTDPKYPGKGGISKRAGLIQSLRKENAEVLLFDSGDIFQGTAYFNYFLGELEIKLMNEMGYDAVTLGNHDFDGGIDNLGQKIDQARFTFINANYVCKDTVLEKKVVPYKIYHKAGLSIGVTGVGIDPAGLIDKKLYGNITYLDPVERANFYAGFLKNEKGCDLVVCLSHLGYEYTTEKVSDKILAAESKDIDIILGGHTHTFLKEPVFITNKKGKKVLISQAGWAGLMLGLVQVSADVTTGEVTLDAAWREII